MWKLFQLAIFIAVSFYAVYDGLQIAPASLLGLLAAMIATSMATRIIDAWGRARQGDGHALRKRDF